MNELSPPGRIEPEQPGAEAVLEHEHEEPVRREHGQHVQHGRLERDHDRAEQEPRARGTSRSRRSAHHERQAPEQLRVEVRHHAGGAAPVAPRAPCCSSTLQSRAPQLAQQAHRRGMRRLLGRDQRDDDRCGRPRPRRRAPPCGSAPGKSVVARAGNDSVPMRAEHLRHRRAPGRPGPHARARVPPRRSPWRAPGLHTVVVSPASITARIGPGQPVAELRREQLVAAARLGILGQVDRADVPRAGAGTPAATNTSRTSIEAVRNGHGLRITSSAQRIQNAERAGDPDAARARARPVERSGRASRSARAAASSTRRPRRPTTNTPPSAIACRNGARTRNSARNPTATVAPEERDRVPRGAQRDRCGRGGSEAARFLLAMPAQHEQRVVHADAEPDHRDHVLREHAHRHPGMERPQAREADRDRDQREHERQQCRER